MVFNILEARNIPRVSILGAVSTYDQHTAWTKWIMIKYLHHQHASYTNKPNFYFCLDPYVKVEMFVNGIRESKDTTKTRQNTQDPMWNHQVVFEINRENPKLLGHVFVFRIFHKDMMMGIQEIGQV